MTIRSVFINRHDNCLRSGLQIAIAAFSVLILSTLGQSAVSTFLFSLSAQGVLPQAVASSYLLTGLLPEAVINFALGFLVIGLYKLFNHKRAAEMGVTPLSRDFAKIPLGMVTTAAILACITLVLLISGNIIFTGISFHLSIFQYLLQMASVSFMEEVLNRGFIQSVVKSRFGTVPSIIVPSLVFMLFHVGNPGITPLSLANIFLAGVFFSVCTHKTGSIWFSFGAHIIWNVGVACIFGLMDVSAQTGSILNFEYTRQSLFNGYAKSPLYGLIATAAWIITITAFALCVKQKRRRSA